MIPLKDFSSVGMSITAEMWAAGICGNGHDIAEMRGWHRSVKPKRCPECVDIRKQWCRKGLHELAEHAKLTTAGKWLCLACQRDKARAEKAVPDKGYSYLFQAMPPDEVVAGAVCTPANAPLFDPITTEEREQYKDAVIQQRINRATAICARCPVVDSCLADAVANKRLGVYGGQYLNLPFYKRLAERHATAS
jgi:hypothetical protein